MKAKFSTYITLFGILAFIAALVTLSRLEYNPKTKQLIVKTKNIDKEHLIAIEHNGKKYSEMVLVAAPGERLKIRKGKIWVNGKEFNSNHFVKLFVVLPENGSIPIEVMNLTQVQAEEMSKILLIREVTDSPNMYDHNIFPHYPALKWNKDNFGPLIVPRKDMVVKLDRFSFHIYKTLFETWEKDTIIYKNKKYFRKATGKELKYYKFKQNYYFFINKYKTFPTDSRTWGPLPESAIIGYVKNN